MISYAYGLMILCNHSITTFNRALLLDKDGKLIEPGTTIKRPKYAETLERIRDNPDDMYEGELAKDIIEDIKSNGGLMTLDDLKQYKVKEVEPLKLKIEDLNLHTFPLPAGGPVLIHMLLMGKGKRNCYFVFFHVNYKDHLVSILIVLLHFVMSLLRYDRIVSYRIVSYRIVSYRIVSYRIVSYRIVSYRIVSYRIVSYRIVSYRIEEIFKFNL